MSENKIISQETKAVIDNALVEAKNYRDMAYEKVQIAETKAAEARASYEAILAEENNYKPLLIKTSLTEEEFLKIINAGGQAEMSTGVEVTLPNTKGTTDVWVVADVNHDGTTGTVDLVAKNLICNSTAAAYTTNNGQWGGPSNSYENSTIRNWLTGTYIYGFSTAIRNSLKTMDVLTNGKSTQDKIKILSMNELGLTSSVYSYVLNNEGTRYPIFEAGAGDSANSKRIKYTSTNVAKWYWTRSPYTLVSSRIWSVNSKGSCDGDKEYDNTIGGVVPAIRF